MRKLILAAALCCTTATATATPVCDGSVARDYHLAANRAGATCWSFLTRFGPDVALESGECQLANDLMLRAEREHVKLQRAGCVKLVNGVSRDDVLYTGWLADELTKYRTKMKWVEGKGWMVK